MPRMVTSRTEPTGTKRPSCELRGHRNVHQALIHWRPGKANRQACMEMSPLPPPPPGEASLAWRAGWPAVPLTCTW